MEVCAYKIGIAILTSEPELRELITVAGSPGQIGSADGVGASARFNYPQGIAVDTNGVLYICDTYNQTLRRIGTNGAVTTIAGAMGPMGSVARQTLVFHEVSRLIWVGTYTLLTQGTIGFPRPIL